MISKEKKIRKITFIGFLINILLSALKIIAGIYGKSQAVLADGIHSLSDTTTDIAVILGSYFWSKPPDSDHPYGHQRIETIVSIFIGIVLLAAGAGIGLDAIFNLHEKKSYPTGWIALVATISSILCKESLYQWTMRTGKKIKSISLTANAWHHRLDAISSIPVLIAVFVSIYWPAWVFIDSVGAIFVSFLIGYAALEIIFKGLKELIDAGAPHELCEKIKTLAVENKAVHQVHAIRTRYVGSSLQVDLHAVVDGDMTVYEGHQVAEDIENRILNDGPDVVDVVVHIEPKEFALPE
ncbi:Cation efflux protein [Candidatus Magnetomorum sp. HK-1]|nr:Cation efflux protein [Candidatus Magnetomorum sp. HK-1]